MPESLCKGACHQIVSVRYKNMSVLSSELRRVAHDEAQNWISKETKPLEQKPVPEHEAKKNAFDLLFDIDPIQESNSNLKPVVGPPPELTAYMAEPENRQKDPLEWWSENKERFPILAKIARKIFAITASSAPTERLFSRAGLLITEKRSTLSGDHVDQNLMTSSNRAFAGRLQTKKPKKRVPLLPDNCCDAATRRKTIAEAILRKEMEESENEESDLDLDEEMALSFLRESMLATRTELLTDAKGHIA